MVNLKDYDYIWGMCRLPPLTRDKEKELADKISIADSAGSADESALLEFFNHNVRLVAVIAKQYSNCGSDFDDLFAVGCLGLYTAVQKYRPDKGAKFSAYASLWIKQKIFRELSEKGGHIIRLPRHKQNLANKIRLWSYKRFESTGDFPNEDEIAEHFSIKKSLVISVRVGYLPYQYLDAPLSTSGSSDDADDRSQASVIGDEGASTPANICSEANENSTALNFVEINLGRLNKRDREIMIRRFGLKDGIAQTLEQLAGNYGVTKECIRLIEVKSLEKMRRWYQLAKKSGTA